MTIAEARQSSINLIHYTVQNNPADVINYIRRRYNANFLVAIGGREINHDALVSEVVHSVTPTIVNERQLSQFARELAANIKHT